MPDADNKAVTVVAVDAYEILSDDERVMVIAGGRCVVLPTSRFFDDERRANMSAAWVNNNVRAIVQWHDRQPKQ